VPYLYDVFVGLVEVPGELENSLRFRAVLPHGAVECTFAQVVKRFESGIPEHVARWRRQRGEQAIFSDPRIECAPFAAAGSTRPLGGGQSSWMEGDRTGARLLPRRIRAGHTHGDSDHREHTDR